MACKYCKENPELIPAERRTNKIKSFKIINGKLFCYGYYHIHQAYLPINYCPKCGRKLEGDGVATNTTPCAGTTTKQCADGLKKLADAANDMSDRLSALIERGA